MESIRELNDRYHFNVYRRLPVVLVKGRGTKIEDENGKVYTDFIAGISVNALGYSHPAIVKAIRKQSGNLIHISNGFYTEPQTRLAELLCRVSGFEKVFFCNSGLEANEAAIKLARRFGKKFNKKGKIISFQNGFHGRSIATITMGAEKYQQGFGPLPEGFQRIAYNDKHGINDTINEDTIAVFVEPVQGEGGVIPADPEFMSELQRLCRMYNVMLVADEIQTGLGRTGKLFGYEHFGIKPDMITLAKSLGGGLPLAAVLATSRVAELLSYGDHGSTFGGNALACAASYAYINTLLEKNLVNISDQKGKYFKDKLHRELRHVPGVRTIRGMGLMIGVELEYPARPVVEMMLEKGFLINATADKTLRFLPPLIIRKNEINDMIDSLKECLLAINAKKSS